MTRSTTIWQPTDCPIDQETGAAVPPLRRNIDFLSAKVLVSMGGLVAVPTETVYGLAADATNADAVARIFAAKERPSFNPLISHLPSLEAALAHGHFNADAMRLAKAFWPGPLTLVVPKRADSPIADLTSAGLDRVALRVPDAPIMRALSHAVGKPLAAPSANRSGRVSPTIAAHVEEELSGRVDMIVDLGPCAVGVESSVVLCAEDVPATLLRPGGIAADALEALLSAPLLRAGTDDQAPASPGMLSSHYAPSIPVRLNVERVSEGEALITFGSVAVPGKDRAVEVISLSEQGDSFEAAQKLFSSLRALDRPGIKAIAVVPIPDDGLGEAINDRLARAALGRRGG